MLSIGKLRSGQERYYLNLSREDYYVESGAPPGRWLGSARSALQLPDSVQSEHLERLARGLDPRTGEVLGQRQSYADGRQRQVGWDLTFSAPKSVSVLWALTDERTRSVIERVQLQAVDAAVDYLEKEAGWCRRGRFGAAFERATLVVAAFQHGTSREQDPQLHTHALVLNVGRRPEGSWGAVQSWDLYRHKMAAGSVYRAALAHGLGHDLGLRVEESSAGTFELAGVPPNLLEALSKRRRQILASLRAAGASSARAADYATLGTRSRKEAVDRDELFARWQETGRAHGFGPEQAARLVHQPTHEASAGRDDALEPSSRRAERLVAECIPTLLRFQTFFTGRRLVEVAMIHAAKLQISPQAVFQAVAKCLANSRDIVQLQPEGKDPRYSTREVFDLEKRLLALGRSMRARTSAGPRPWQWNLKRAAAGLTAKQEESLRRLVSERTGLRTLRGRTPDRSAVLSAAVAAWKAAGFDVVACTNSAGGARETERSLGLERATTVGALLRAHSIYQRARDLYWHFTRGTSARPAVPLGRKTIVVVDNAERVETRSLLDVMRLVDRFGATAVLAGDPNALPAMRAGSPFWLLHRRSHGAEAPAAPDPASWRSKVLSALQLGDGREVLRSLVTQGRLLVGATRERALRDMLIQWQRYGARDVAQNVLVVGNAADVERVNEMAQGLRLQSGALDPRARLRIGRRKIEHPTLGGMVIRRSLFAPSRGHQGDRVRFGRSSAAHGVRAGDRGVVERVNRLLGSVTIRLDRSESVRLGIVAKWQREIRVTLTAREAAAWIDLDYSSRPSQLEGRAFEQVFAMCEPGQHAHECLHDNLVRCTEGLRLYADEMTAGDDLRALASAMSRADPNPLARELAPGEPRERADREPVLDL